MRMMIVESLKFASCIVVIGLQLYLVGLVAQDLCFCILLLLFLIDGFLIQAIWLVLGVLQVVCAWGRNRFQYPVILIVPCECQLHKGVQIVQESEKYALLSIENAFIEILHLRFASYQSEVQTHLFRVRFWSDLQHRLAFVGPKYTQFPTF